MSIVKRCIVSVGANIARAAVSLVVGLLVARGLGPADYGNLAYLLGSFWAIRALLDMGSSSAFYTFIAQRQRSKSYYTVYFCWLGLQFMITAGLVVLVLPQSVIERIWLGQERATILLAFLATFLQNQVWQTVVQMHEAVRLTIRVQIGGLVIIVLHLLLVVLLQYGGWLGVESVLGAIVVEYLAAAAWMSATLRRSVSAPGSEHRSGHSSVRSAIAEYFKYCQPMIVIAIFTFFYELADRWLLQRYGGPRQQGFYQVASQLSTVSLLATTSILNILWKEVAEACERGDHGRVFALHQKTSRLLVVLAAAVACFLAPWAEQLVDLLLGPAFHAAWPALFLMLLYPIHQTMGQINGALFMATAQNASFMKITVAGLLLSIPVSYLLIGPTDSAGLPALELGAMGLAIKIVGLNLLMVNIEALVIARHYRKEHQWQYQVTIIALLLALGYAARFAVEGLAPGIAKAMGDAPKPAMLITMALGALLYLAGMFALFTRAPGLAGFERAEIAALIEQMRGLAKRRA